LWYHLNGFYSLSHHDETIVRPQYANVSQNIHILTHTDLIHTVDMYLI
jgi:hypothetical protein